MSIYFSGADEEQEFGASNTGWGDVCRWVETQKDLKALSDLCDKGWADKSETLLSDLKKAVSNKTASPDVKTVLQTLLDFAESADEIVMVGDGMTSAKDVQRADSSTLESWSEDDLDELCTITESDIQAAANSATPKLRDLNTAPPAN